MPDYPSSTSDNATIPHRCILLNPYLASDEAMAADGATVGEVAVGNENAVGPYFRLGADSDHVVYLGAVIHG